MGAGTHGEATGRPGEAELIARYFAPLARDPGARGLVDDAATLAPPAGEELVLTADAVVAGVHFDPAAEAGTVARKALRVNLSDLAAKGARPLGYLMTLALADDWTPAWMTDFAAGLAADQDLYGLSLLGGDTVRTPGPVSVSIMALGAVPAGGMVRRDAARAGARVFVSGTVGDAALGLVLAREPGAARRLGLGAGEAAHLAGRLALPQPRLALAGALRAHACAAMDVSDGLVGDLAKMCRASGVGARIEAARVPLSPAARAALAADATLLPTAITGGDDYEILAAVADDEVAGFVAAAAAAGVPVSDIGRFEADMEGVAVNGPDGRAMTIAHGAYTHF